MVLILIAAGREIGICARWLHVYVRVRGRRTDRGRASSLPRGISGELAIARASKRGRAGVRDRQVGRQLARQAGASSAPYTYVYASTYLFITFHLN